MRQGPADQRKCTQKSISSLDFLLSGDRISNFETRDSSFISFFCESQNNLLNLADSSLCTILGRIEIRAGTQLCANHLGE